MMPATRPSVSAASGRVALVAALESRGAAASFARARRAEASS
jgi:hypothetical protein